MVHILSGSNWFGVKARLDELRTEFVKKNGELAIENIDCEEATLEQILNSAESLPFLSDKKMIVLDRLSNNKLVAEKINEIIEKVPDSVQVIIVEPPLDKRSIYYKSLKKLKGFEEFNELENHQTASWLVSLAKKKSGKIYHSDAAYLVARAGNNQQNLANEITKLLSYGSEINRQAIDLLVDATPQSTVFNLLDSVFAGDAAKTLRLYDDQRSQGTEPLNILGMLAWQLHAVSLALAAEAKSSAEISSKSGLNPYVVQKGQAVARAVDKTVINKLLQDLLNLDIEFKNTTIDQDNALKNLLVSLA